MPKKLNKSELDVKGVQMPHNLEAEQALLGCMLLDPEIQMDCISKLQENDFFVSSHQYIFEAMVEINRQNSAIDIVTLLDMLEKSGTIESAGGVDYITKLTEVIPSSANYNLYLSIVTRDGLLRRIIKGSAEIISTAQVAQDDREALAFAEKTVFDLSSTRDSTEMAKISSVIPEVVNKFDKISKDKNAFRGLSTGFKRLDYITNGLHETDFILIAARPSVGKTSFAMNIVENIATTQDKVCAVFSLEMGREQLTQRMLCSVAEVSMESALKGNLTKQEWLRLARAREKLSKAKIFIDDSTLITPAEMLSKCRRLKRRHGLDLVMIDYIQLMTGGNKNADNRQQEVSEISRSLKVLAKEMKVPVLALSQLSRGIETRTDQTPQLSDIRESGAIEQDADIVMFISRKKEIKDENDNPNIAEISISKHRNGPTGTIKLFFKGECTKFMNLEDNPQTEETPQEEKAELNEIAPNSPENERVSDFEQVGFEEDKEYDNEDYSDDTDGEIFG
ncbi:MAG: replicative DNA helicase [Clostridia bacterium]|nr:replicative DNA helicase [Clostridia bacterium]